VCLCVYVCVLIVTMEIFMFHMYIIYIGIVIIKIYCKRQGRDVKNRPRTEILWSFTSAFLEMVQLVW
jgi:hypothetical protein